MSPKRNGLRQQVTETKERPLELRGERDKENAAGKGMRKAQIHSLETLLSSLFIKRILCCRI